MSGVSGFVVSPSDPVLGEVAYFQTFEDGAPNEAASYKWEYRYNLPEPLSPVPLCVAGWATGGSTSGAWTLKLPFPGNVDVRMTATYQTIRGPDGKPFTKAPTVINKNVQVAPASGIDIIKGESVSCNNDPNGLTLLEVNFRIKAGGRNAGEYISAIAQEKVVDKILLGQVVDDDADYTPNQPDSRFFLQGNLIIDNKRNKFSAASWNALNVGDTFYTATQKMRLKFSDSCGNVLYTDLPPFQMKRVKVSPTEWQLQTNN